MKKIMLGSLVTMLSTLAFNTAWAACSSDNCSDVYVDQLYLEEDGDIWIQTSGTESSLSMCTADSGIYLFLPASASGSKQLYATLLAAQLANSKVDIYLIPSSNPCRVMFARIYRQQ